ncbi:MAG: hypothetical protein Ta2E_04630 [Mycoplasmoidaceae bacterium]|nr:MAG: hypothetical protein Ta2E_04630 [Mycoplasmoidaceae bacterium]
MSLSHKIRKNTEIRRDRKAAAWKVNRLKKLEKESKVKARRAEANKNGK